MADVEERMSQLAQRIAALQDVGPHFMKAMEAQARALELEMQHLKDQYRAIPERVYDPAKARALYEMLSKVDLRQCVIDARAKNDNAVLRDILALVVDEARITERGSHTGQAKKATWARASVRLTANVELLLASGRLRLQDELEAAPIASAQERKRESQRRYRARKQERMHAG